MLFAAKYAQVHIQLIYVLPLKHGHAHVYVALVLV